MQQKKPMKAEPVDPRAEVAGELKQHLLGLALTHRKMVAQMQGEAPDKKKGKKAPAPDGDEDDHGDHEEEFY